MLELFMFLHVGAAIVAFGPTFAFPIIGAMAGRQPPHGNFALRLGEAVSNRLVYPFALSMPVSGVGLIYFGDVELTRPWLLVAIVLYVVAIAYSLVVQRTVILRMVEVTSGPPPAGGPPPQFLALTRRSQQGGLLLTALFLALLALMIFKPGG